MGTSATRLSEWVMNTTSATGNQFHVNQHTWLVNAGPTFNNYEARVARPGIIIDLMMHSIHAACIRDSYSRLASGSALHVIDLACSIPHVLLKDPPKNISDLQHLPALESQPKILLQPPGTDTSEGMNVVKVYMLLRKGLVYRFSGV